MSSDTRDEDTAVVHIGQTAITLRRPASYTTRRDIASASATNQARAMAAALGVCWVAPVKHRPKVAPYERDGSPIRYGGDIIDDLIERGIGYAEIMAVSVIAFNLCADGVFSELEVKAAEDFSAAPEDSTST